VRVTAAAAMMAGKTAFDGENGSASIGDRETDVDRGDHHKPERAGVTVSSYEDAGGEAACAAPMTSPHRSSARSPARTGSARAATLTALPVRR
jgi:hypothetical protein